MKELVLKPCPLCGRAPAVEPTDPATEGNAWTQIVCSGHGHEVSVVVYAERGHRATAARRWNTRKGQQ